MPINDMIPCPICDKKNFLDHTEGNDKLEHFHCSSCGCNYTNKLPPTLEEKTKWEILDAFKPFFDERDRRTNAMLDKYFSTKPTPFWKIILGGMIFVGAIITTIMSIMTIFQLFWKVLGLE